MQNRIFQNNHFLNLTLYPKDGQMILIQNSLYRNNVVGQKDQFFVDMTYRYTVKKWKTDMEFSGNNLLNNNRYLQQFSNDIQLVQSYFELRPRQFLVSTRFKF